MNFAYKNLNKTRGTYMIYEDKKRKEIWPKMYTIIMNN
jgi:hypothetical protein